MHDPTESIRFRRRIEINAVPAGRPVLESRYGRVWSAEELRQEFEVLGFLAPYVVVRGRTDGARGSLEFQNAPRFYFNYEPYDG